MADKFQQNRDEGDQPAGVKESQEASTQVNQGVVDRGVNCSNSPEVVAVFDKAPCELVYNKKDSWIVLGRDRTCSKASGHGGAGHTGAHMIDLVVGRNKRLKGNPSFMRDAARIYISQKTDSDLNFECCFGHVGLSKERSGIGMIADDVRILARKGIKLITQGQGTKNSLDIEEQTTVGIDLIGGNQGAAGDTDGVLNPKAFSLGLPTAVPTMQGIAKSVNTAYALKNLVQLHMDLVNMLETFMSNQQSINDTLATHAHIDPVSGTTGPEMPDAMVANIWDTINTLVLCELMIDKHKLNCTNYLDNHTEENKGSWIGSRFNYTN